MRKLGLTATAAVSATGLAAATAQADTFTVTTNGDGPAAACTGATPAFECATLRDAIAGANANAGDDTITFQSTVTGEITLAASEGALVVGPAAPAEALTVQGPGATALSVSGDTDSSGTPNAGDTGIFSVQSSSGAFALSGLTLTEGYSTQGGAISTASPVPLTVTDAVLSGNTATGAGAGGGAIYTNAGVNISDSTLADNTSAGPGGAVAQLATVNAFTEIENSTITGNEAAGSGGAVDLVASIEYATKYGTLYDDVTSGLVVSGSTLSGNTAGTGGGAISARGKYSPVDVLGSTITGNATNVGPGGAVAQLSKYGAASVTTSRLTGNAAGGVGGGLAIQSKYGEFSLDSTTISGNEADGAGGGLSVSGGGAPGNRSGDDSFIVDSTISGNSATSGGGLDLNLNTPAALDISYTTISGNESDLLGGGISFGANTASPVTLTDSTISGNSADIGAGVAFDADSGSPSFGSTGSASFYNSTVASNAAGTAGGGIYLAAYEEAGSSPPNPISATVPLTSTIVADNSAAGVAQDLDRADTATAGGVEASFSLIETSGDVPVTQSPAGSTILARDPQLGPLAENGGPTRTHLPARTSPVVDAGDSAASLELDQRGLPRRVQDPNVPNAGDGTDIGSVELPAPDPTPPPPTPPDTTPPNTRISSSPKKVIRTTRRNLRVAVRFFATEPSTFQCKIDKRPYRTCRSPLRFSATSAPKRGKVHTVLIRATDTAGNVESTPRKVRFRVIRRVVGE